jgi:hypothetical protein
MFDRKLIFDKNLPPWSIEFNKKEFVILKFFIEVCIGENEDTIFLSDFFSED